MTDVEAEPMLRVGELAKAAGVTVRALHHYEEMGLLPATCRTTAGHRVYGAEAVDRLYRLTRLRRLGMSLDQIRAALDAPHTTLDAALRIHLAALDAQLAQLARLRNGVGAALAHVNNRDDPSHDLLEVLSTMDNMERLIRRRVSILVYRDPAAAHRYLTEVFGFSPGEVTRAADGQAMHAEVTAGEGTIWLHPESEEYRLASPQSTGASTACMAVIVEDVDEHHRLVAEKGGDIVYPPIDQPYGYREYSARDCEGALWSFMKETTT